MPRRRKYIRMIEQVQRTATKLIPGLGYVNYGELQTTYHHHHWAVVSRGWTKACRLQVSLSCDVPCQIVSFQYLSRSSLQRLTGLSCRRFFSYGLHSVTRYVHRSSLKRLMCPCQGPCHFSHIADYIYDFCPLPDTR